MAGHPSLSDEIKLGIHGYLKGNRFRNDAEYREMISYLPGPPPEKSLAYLYPKLKEEWNYKENEPLKPESFWPGSGMKVWWMCEKKHEWKAVVRSRTSGSRCPRCARHIAGEKLHLYALNKSGSLAEKYPELAKEWHPTKNGDLTPHDVTPGTDSKVWWKCKVNPKHEWKSRVSHRVNGSGCPKCNSERRRRAD